MQTYTGSSKSLNNKYIRPSYLKPGDNVGLIATARKVNEEEMMMVHEVFRSWKLNLIDGRYLYGSDRQFGGTDSARAADLQHMLDDPGIRAIIVARGGYGTVRIIDRIDFTAFKQNPKWIAGYSDITVLHSHIHHNFNTETLHAAMPLNFTAGGLTPAALESLRKALFGENIEYHLDAHPLNRTGKARGILTGGNLSVIYSIQGSVSDIDTRGKILFLEDLDEYLYHIDRMMMSLKRSGKLENLAGLVVGGMTDMKDNTVPFGLGAEEIILDAAEEYGYPVCFSFPAGHIADNRAMYLGRNVMMEVGEKVDITYTG